MHTRTLFRSTRLFSISWHTILPVLAFIVGLGNMQVAHGQQAIFYDESISFNRQPTGSASLSTVSYAGMVYPGDTPYTTYEKLGTTSTNPPTSNPSIGVFDINTPRTSQLYITNASIVAGVTRDRNNNVIGTITGARVFYRVYLSGVSPLPSYTAASLNDAGSFAPGAELYSVDGNLDLLQGLLSGGVYTVDIKYELDVRNNSTGNTVTYTDPSSSYQANFTVTSPPTTPAGGVTTWQSKTSSDWFLASNWTNGVPTSSSNAVIPENAEGTNIIFPVLNNLNRHYVVNNLTLQGNTGSSKAQITILNAVLRVYGDIYQITGGLVGSYTNSIGVADSTQNSTLVLAGANQVITGRLSVPDIIVAGSGVKSVVNTMLPGNTLSFRPTNATAGVIIQSAGTRTDANGNTTYVFDTTGNSLINLSNTGVINTADGSKETNTSYAKGIVSATSQFVAGSKRIFGNIGLEITPNHSAANITVTRTIGDPLIGPTTPAPGVTPVPIKRQYQVVGDDNSASSAFASSANNIVFHYLDSSYELNGISESNLALFRTNTGSVPFTPLPSTLDQDANVVTSDNVASFSNFYLTLGDKTNPLPVSLTAFTAVRNGNSAVLSWTTASEKNNTGFEVQVSTDGASFRKLAFVATQDANSNKKLVYGYVDAESGKANVRYYRLRQIDTDGTEAFSPVRAVSFSGVASVAPALAAYPNPFTTQLAFNLDATAVGNGVAHLQLVDMTGRIVLEQDLKVANASLTLTDLGGLHSGLYLAKLTLPDGTTQKVRVQKQ